MNTAIKHMLIANVAAPIIASIILELANLQMKANNIAAFSFLALLLATNIYHATKFGAYRAINILLFFLNGLSLFLIGEISFITGLYIAMLWLISILT